MNALEIVGSIIGGMIFLVWLVSMYAWIRRGCPMPKWLHAVAFGCFIVGAGLGAGLVILGGRSVWIALACGLGFPSAMYVGWLWMFGPEWAEKSKTG